MHREMKMHRKLKDSLDKLKKTNIRASRAFDEEGTVRFQFSDGTDLRADYWRLLEDARELLSSFDDRQQYGLPAPIDAVNELQSRLSERGLLAAELDTGTGDLLFGFERGLKLQIFGFSGYESWEIHFPDGTGNYSNHTKTTYRENETL